MTRNPMKDAVAIVGVGITEYSRHSEGRTSLSLGFEAAKRAIQDAGLSKSDINGICGTSVIEFEDLQEGLGIPEITWYLNTMRGTLPPHQIAAAAHAVNSGACETALVVHSHLRLPQTSRSAASDPIRARMLPRAQARNPPQSTLDHASLWAHSADPYGAWGGRYLWEYNLPRETFGLIAINNRANACRNPHAIMQTPITMEDYLSARMIREPLCLFDMDLPCDGGTALIVTTAEKAARSKQPAVYIHASTFAETRFGTQYYEQARSYRDLSIWPCARTLWGKSDLTLDEVDVFYPYDGFSNIATSWIEAVGYCKPGEAYRFMKKHWNHDESRLRIRDKVLVQPGGGSLSEGASQGFGYFYDAVQQLRGQAPNQVPGAKVALVCAGGLFHNTTAYILRVA